ncbi:hypothetical protein [Bacillus sp. UMB0893]|uniref:hypothetical protein n=1 Tax=Bacillus sp. UMB0893 TaxID=2066053 RepID=UPI000C783A2E|nr:hypothetical protein [Bacillus sp. UMB0893]PLR65992.1 hypothetical protein CYJ36_20170 [Bacillus sp. UMB0893]
MIFKDNKFVIEGATDEDEDFSPIKFQSKEPPKSLFSTYDLKEDLEAQISPFLREFFINKMELIVNSKEDKDVKYQSFINLNSYYQDVVKKGFKLT